MASIEKLGIRGIRAFSPEDDEQVISFSYPLTFIVGKNGCGKTTIIEALKYAVTGSLPPGVKSGQAFVHDPKSICSSTVKASVKLSFKNRAGNKMVVARSMEVSQKKSTITFKALDGVLRLTDENGQRQSLSHKCSELDRQIPQLLGVSKSILEHVVFCHQEEASWPLMEGAVLKKRFDDIFDSTKYVKALEAIKDTKKIYVGRAKDLKTELAELSGHKHAALGLRQDLDKARQKLSDTTDEIQNISKELQVWETKKIELQLELSKKNEIERKIESQKNLIKHEFVRIDAQRNNIQEDLTKDKSKDDLMKILQSFDSNMQDDLRLFRVAKKEVEDLKIELNELQQRKVTITQQLGELIGEKRNHDRNLQSRLEMIDAFASKFDLQLSVSQSQNTEFGVYSTQQSRLSTTIYDDCTKSVCEDDGTHTMTMTAEDLRAFCKSAELKGSQLRKQLDDHRTQSQREEDEIQSQLNDLNAKLKTIENELDRTDLGQKNAHEELQTLSKGVSRSLSRDEIEEAKKRAAQLAAERDELMNNSRQSEIQESIRANQEEAVALKKKIEEYNEVVKELRKFADEKNSIHILNQQVDHDIQDLIKIKDGKLHLLDKYGLVCDIPSKTSGEEVFVEKIGALVSNADEKLNTAARNYNLNSKNLKIKESQYSEKSTLLNLKKENLVERQRKLNDLNDKVMYPLSQVIQEVRAFEQSIENRDNDDPTNENMKHLIPLNIEPQQLLEHFADKLEDIVEATPAMIRKTLKSMKKIAVKRNSRDATSLFPCPCCLRDMDQDQVLIFDKRMNELADLDKSPLFEYFLKEKERKQAIREKYKIWRETVSNCLNGWIDYQRITSEVTKLEKEVQSEEVIICDLKDELDQTKEKTEKYNQETSDLRHLLDLAKRLNDDTAKIVDKLSKIRIKERWLNCDMSHKAQGKELMEVERDVEMMNKQKDSLMNSSSKLNEESTALNDKIVRVTNKARMAEQIVRENEEKYAQDQKAAARKKELNEIITANKAKMEQLQEEISPLRQKVKAKETERNRYRTVAKNEEDNLLFFVNDFSNEYEKITTLSDQISQFEASNKLSSLQEINDENQCNAEVQNSKRKQLEIKEAELVKKKTIIDNQEGFQKNIENNLRLHDMLNNLDALQNVMSQLEDEKDEMETNSEGSRREFERVCKMIQTQEADRTRREGALDALKTQSRDIKRKLGTAEYKDIDERHRVKMIEHETTALAVSDLDIYYTALDKSILKYHGLKIEEINKIINELWILTYKGEDITSIKLTSDQDEGSKATRSYNYRVVMTKGTTELDMRGRCSAGQRILASIVIRLALAETFCLNCGVMALDEPTQNLDYANKRGLAIALAQIIAHRSAQKNFQLVLITHDEDFVGMMKNELSAYTGFSMPERYFQVSREEARDGNYYSKIHDMSWDDM